METHPQLTLCQAGSKPRGKGGKGGKDLSKQGEMMGKKKKKERQLQVNELGNENSGAARVSFYYKAVPRGKGRN